MYVLSDRKEDTAIQSQYSRTPNICPQCNQLHRITNLVNCEFFPLKLILNPVPTMKIVHNTTLGAADETTTLDAITIYDLTSHLAHTATGGLGLRSGQMTRLCLTQSLFTVFLTYT